MFNGKRIKKLEGIICDLGKELKEVKDKLEEVNRRTCLHVWKYDCKLAFSFIGYYYYKKCSLCGKEVELLKTEYESEKLSIESEKLSIEVGKAKEILKNNDYDVED